MTGEVFVNSQSLGQFGPYTPFELDVTDRVLPGENSIKVELSDLDGFEPWGRKWVTAFPRYGGIIRDISLEVKSPVYIENARLDYTLTGNYTQAECRLNVWLVNTHTTPAAVELTGTLTHDQQTCPYSATVQVTPGKSHHVLTMKIEDVVLWSPDSPAIYDLTLGLRGPQDELDRFEAPLPASRRSLSLAAGTFSSMDKSSF